MKSRGAAITRDVLINHLPRVTEGLMKGYVDENQILVIYDHAVRVRILTGTLRSTLVASTLDSTAMPHPVVMRTRAAEIIAEILTEHLPAIQAGLEEGFIDENRILVIYDLAVRARILTEHAQPETPTV